MDITMAWSKILRLHYQREALRHGCKLERFSFSRNLRTALSLCFHAIPDGKPLRTFPGITLATSCELGVRGIIRA
jgi:hypothetical protein